VIANRLQPRKGVDQQVTPLPSIDGRRFRKPMLYPLSYEGVRVYRQPHLVRHTRRSCSGMACLAPMWSQGPTRGVGAASMLDGESLHTHSARHPMITRSVTHIASSNVERAQTLGEDSHSLSFRQTLVPRVHDGMTAQRPASRRAIHSSAAERAFAAPRASAGSTCEPKPVPSPRRRVRRRPTKPKSSIPAAVVDASGRHG
jgi:hypothetical protein